MTAKTTEKTNLEVLERSNTAPKVGDIFALKPRGKPFMFGRVIRTDSMVGPFPAILIYVYATTAERELPLPPLKREQLLLPPLFTNQLPWVHGLFKTVARQELTPSDVFKVHSFRHPVSGKYFDDRGRALPTPSEPVGTYALDSYRTIDDDISDALGIPQVP